MKKKILVIGDIILDEFIYGSVERISPEAPTPILKKNGIKKLILGGAANVANNITAFNTQVDLCGTINKEDKTTPRLLKENGIGTNLLFYTNKITTIKTRYVTNQYQLLRVDEEDTEMISVELERYIIKKLREVINDYDIIIISDYNKGLITENMMMFLIQTKKKILVDPKPENKNKYLGGVYLVKSNLKEAEQITGRKFVTFVDIHKMGHDMIEYFNSNILITCGKNGMYLFEKNKEPLFLKSKAKDIFDVTGAGDTVISTIGNYLNEGISLEKSVIYSNKAASIVVGKVGTSKLTPEEIEKYIK